MTVNKYVERLKRDCDGTAFFHMAFGRQDQVPFTGAENSPEATIDQCRCRSESGEAQCHCEPGFVRLRCAAVSEAVAQNGLPRGMCAVLPRF
jgi:hypothetical protein